MTSASMLPQEEVASRVSPVSGQFPMVGTPEPCLHDIGSTAGIPPGHLGFLCRQLPVQVIHELPHEALIAPGQTSLPLVHVLSTACTPDLLVSGPALDKASLSVVLQRYLIRKLGTACWH